jgi:RNA polymerase sigma-70 factor (ECF subfamily)
MDEMRPTLEPVQGGLAGATARADACVVSAWSAHYEELRVFLVRQVRDEAAAEDLLQETFLRFLQQVRGGPVPDNVRAWLYRVAANLAVSRARRLRVAVRGVLQLGQRLGHDTTDDPPDETALIHAARSELLGALSDLEPDARAALLLAAQGFSGREIASVIGRTDMATRTLMCRARRSVRARLEREEMSA